MPFSGAKEAFNGFLTFIILSVYHFICLYRHNQHYIYSVMLVPIFCNGPPPPDKGNNSFSINILKPLQLQPPDYDHTEGHPRHFYLFSGQFFEKIAHVLNLFPPTFASTKKHPINIEFFGCFCFRLHTFSFCEDCRVHRIDNSSYSDNELL